MTLPSEHVASAASVAHDVASARNTEVLNMAPADSRDVLEHAIHAAAANGTAVLLCVGGLVAVVAALLSFLMLRPGLAPEQADIKSKPVPAA